MDAQWESLETEGAAGPGDGLGYPRHLLDWTHGPGFKELSPADTDTGSALEKLLIPKVGTRHGAAEHAHGVTRRTGVPCAQG